MASEYKAAVIVQVAGSPIVAEPVAAVAWNASGYAVYAPGDGMLEAVIREFLEGAPGETVETGLESFAKSTHPYGLETTEVLPSDSPAQAARAALVAWKLRASSK